MLSILCQNNHTNLHSIRNPNLQWRYRYLLLVPPFLHFHILQFIMFIWLKRQSIQSTTTFCVYDLQLLIIHLKQLTFALLLLHLQWLNLIWSFLAINQLYHDFCIQAQESSILTLDIFILSLEYFRNFISFRRHVY